MIAQSPAPAHSPYDNETYISQPFRFDRGYGVPDDDIRAVAKGKDGFIWLGTQDGLARFDGIQFKFWKNDTNDPRSLPANEVVSLLPLENRIWVGTSDGPAVLDLVADTFIRYDYPTYFSKLMKNHKDNLEVSCIHQDAAGDIWLGFRIHGIFRYDSKTNSFEHYPYNETAARNYIKLNEYTPHTLSIASNPANDSLIWVGTSIGLQEIHKPGKKVKSYYYPHSDLNKMAWQNAFRRLYFHDDGLLYVGSWHAGMHLFDPRYKTFVKLQVKAGTNPDFLEYPIGRIVRKSKDEIWISSGPGLTLYNTRRQEIIFSIRNDTGKSLYYGVDVIDDKGRHWYGEATGCYVYDPVVRKFPEYNFADINGIDWGFAFYLKQMPGSDEISVIARNADGIFHFNRRTKSWRKTPIPQHYVKNFDALDPRGISLDPDGNVTISSTNGLFSWSPKTDRITPHPLQKQFARPISSSILWDSQGQFWFYHGEDGLIRYNPQANSFQYFHKTSGYGFPQLAYNFTGKLFEDSRGNVWISNVGGIVVWHAEKGNFFAFPYSTIPERSFSGVEGVCEDRQGRVWFTGWGAVAGYAEAAHPEKGLVKKITLDPSRTGSTAYGITSDKSGDIWVWAKKSVVKMNGADLSQTYYAFDYFTTKPDFYSLSTLPDGMLAFGGRNFILIVDPSQVRLNDEMPEPYITEFRVQQEVIPFYQDPSRKYALPLAYWENYFAFAFSAKAFTLGNGVRFRYRLLGFQDEWTDAGERRFVNYTNVPGGNYTFQLQAANNEGVWNKKLLEIPVFVATAWWATWWFRGTALLALALLGYAYYRYRIRLFRRESELKSEFEKRLSAEEMNALRAQMNPHFLFNSLNSIDNFILKNESRKASEYLNNFARLMRLILQNSRSNYVNLKDELEALELYLQMESLRFKDKFQYEIKVADGLDTASTDIPPMLIQPYVENAIWHGLMHKSDKSEGWVEVSVSQQNGALHCRIEDNGIGRERAAEIKASHPASGGGKKSFGMQITQDRIAMINKLYNANTSVEIVDLKNEEGEATGTRVELVIPV